MELAGIRAKPSELTFREPHPNIHARLRIASPAHTSLCSVPSVSQTRYRAVCSGTHCPSTTLSPLFPPLKLPLERPRSHHTQQENPMAPLPPPEIPTPQSPQGCRFCRRDVGQCACAARREHEEGHKVEGGDADGAGDVA